MFKDKWQIRLCGLKKTHTFVKKIKDNGFVALYPAEPCPVAIRPYSIISIQHKHSACTQGKINKLGEDRWA